MITYIIIDRRGMVIRDANARDINAALTAAENYCNGLPQEHYCVMIERYNATPVKVRTFKMCAPYGEPVQILNN